MRYRPLGATGLTVSEIGFGCASWWGKRQFAEREALGLAHRAMDLGITLFDTGSSYAEGRAEPRLGRALRGRDTHGLVIASKAGTFHAGRGRVVRDFSPAAIVASAERTVRNLGLDALPLLQLHGPSASELTDDLCDALQKLKSRGLVRATGVNSFDPDVVRMAVRLPQFDVVMVDFNVLKPERASLITEAAAAGKAVLAGMPLAMGHTAPWLSRLRGPRDLWYLARGMVRHRSDMRLGRRFRFLHTHPAVTGAQAALAYVLAHPGVSSAVVGATRLKHLKQNVEASGMALPPGLLERIRAAQTAAGRGRATA